MNNPIVLIITLVLVALIIFVGAIIVKNFMAPQKIGSIRRMIKDGKLNAAEKLAKSILAKDSRDYVAHYWLGKVYLAEKKPEQAFIEFKTVNDNALFDGTIPEADFRKEIAVLYNKYGEPQSALREYMLLTKIDPQNAENFYNVGKMYEVTGEENMGIGFYQKAIELNKKHSKAHSALGYLMLKNKQMSEAKKEIDTAIRLSPETWINYFYEGKLLKEMNDYAAAIKAFEKSERDHDIRQKALIEKGSCYMLSEQFESAESEYTRAIQNAKDDTSQETLYARYFLASCYENTHKIEKAIEQWEKIRSRNPRFLDVNSKLNEYKDLQNNDSMKEYLTSGTSTFMELCKKVAAVAYKVEVQDSEEKPYGCSMVVIETKKDSWMSGRKQIFRIDFYRNAEPVNDGAIRKMAEDIKTSSYTKAIIFSSSGFTKAAENYAEGRPIVLIGKDQLELILSKSGV